MTRELLAYVDQARVGTLRENSGIWSFEYTPEWAAAGYDLSPGLPRAQTRIIDSGTNRPVQWFFDNLLPEDAARTQLASASGMASVDAWDLLARFGAESAGALTLLPPDTLQPEGELLRLTDAELEARIRAMPLQPLAARAPKRMSLAGAQQKLPVVLQSDGSLYEPSGARASTHIVKPDVTAAHYPHSAVNEWFCARIAQALGLPVPPVHLRYVPSPVYIIERFDRRTTGAAVERRHTLDAAQLLSLAAGAKYTRSGAIALRDVVELCRAKAPSRIALFRWVLFNLLIGNGDAHLKNISLYAGPDGYSLAPHYDLVSTGAWARPELLSPGEPAWAQVPLTFAVGCAHLLSEVTVADVQAFAAGLGVPSGAVARSLKSLVGGILAAAGTVHAEFEARADVPAAARAGELRMLLAIRHLPLTTMVNQLSR